MKVSLFCEFGLKTLIQLRFLGLLPPKCGAVPTKPPKRNFWLRKHVIWCKDRQNRCNRCGDIAIFRYFQDGGCPPSWICGGTELGHTQTLLGILHRFAKFGWNRCSRFDTVKVLVFHTFGLKSLFRPPKLGFWGLFTP